MFNHSVMCMVCREYNQYQSHCEDCSIKEGISNICLEHYTKVQSPRFSINCFNCWACHVCFFTGRTAHVRGSSAPLRKENWPKRHGKAIEGNDAINLF